MTRDLKGSGMHDTHNDDSNKYVESIAKSNGYNRK